MTRASRAGLAAGIVWMCAPLVWPQAKAPDAAGWLSAVRQAMGGARWDEVRTLHMRGAVEIGDLKGTFESWFDPRRQRSYVDLLFSNPVLGGVRSTEGWNGKVSWSADQTGDVCVAGAEEARRNAALNAYIDSFAYLLMAAPPADLRVKGDSDGERRFHILRMTPPGDPPFELWIDPATNLVGRAAPVTGPDPDITSYGDFRTVQGLQLPFSTEERGAESGKILAITRADSIEINRDPPEGVFDPPPAKIDGLQFPADGSAVTIDFHYADGHIHIPVSINGHRLENFVFDTGMNNTISAARAKTLGLSVVKAGAAYGAGPDAVDNGMTKVDRLEIGGLTMRDQIVDTTALPDAGGPPLDGGVGYELARRAIVTVDYASHNITFARPEAFHPPAGAIALPIQFASITEILVDGSLNGIRGEFQLDTGQDMSLTVNHPFAERNGMLRRYGSGKKNSAEGVGGEAEMVLFKPSQFTIGNLKLSAEHPAIMLSNSGSGAEEYVAGVIGNKILQQYKVTLDYGHRMVYLEKAPHFKEVKEVTYTMSAPDPARPGRGGWLGFVRLRRREGEPVQIVEVAADSPAAQAGIEAGDWLLTINGAPTERLSVAKLFGPMVVPPGLTVRFTVRHGETSSEVKLTTQ